MTRTARNRGPSTYTYSDFGNAETEYYQHASMRDARVTGWGFTCSVHVCAGAHACSGYRQYVLSTVDNAGSYADARIHMHSMHTYIISRNKNHSHIHS